MEQFANIVAKSPDIWGCHVSEIGRLTINQRLILCHNGGENGSCLFVKNLKRLTDRSPHTFKSYTSLNELMGKTFRAILARITVIRGKFLFFLGRVKWERSFFSWSNVLQKQFVWCGYEVNRDWVDDKNCSISLKVALTWYYSSFKLNLQSGVIPLFFLVPTSH